MDWKFYIDDPKTRALNLCYGYLDWGDGYGYGNCYSNEWGRGDGYGLSCGCGYGRGYVIYGYMDGTGQSSTRWGD